MRYYGEVKHFGGFNNKTRNFNDYGFITNIGDKQLEYKDIYFHKEELLFSQSKVEEGLLVTFELDIDNRNRCSAKFIQMLENEENLQVIERCLGSKYPSVWLSVLKNYSKLVPLNKGIEIAEKRLSTVTFGETINIRNYIPSKYYSNSRTIRNHLTPRDRLSICSQLLNIEKLSSTAKKEILAELTDLISENNFSEDILFNKIPKNLFVENEFLRSKISPFKYLICLLDISKSIGELSLEIKSVIKENNYSQIFIDEVVKKINSEEEIEELIQILDDIPEDKRIVKLQNLNTKLVNNPILFNYLPPIEKFNMLWNKNESEVKELWLKLDYKTKLLYLFRKAKNDLKIDFLSNVEEVHPIIRAVMKIIWVKDKNNLKSTVFNQSHQLIQDYIIDIAWKLNTDIKLSPLLPECPFGYVKYCEGKPWERDGEDCVFCPRKNDNCDFETDRSKFKIYPNRELSWDKWTLLELFDYSNITPEVNNLYDPEQYVNRLSGWINRLDEIRERLKCTVCGKALLSNYKYSKNLAVYNSTVFYCQCGTSSNQNVYISHCWACREIIDSREDNHKLEEYYLCLKCGSGPKSSSNYMQGSMCPKCGSNRLNNTDLYNRDYQCMRCGHSIHIPPHHKLTGI